jgi:hypothetical protein
MHASFRERAFFNGRVIFGEDERGKRGTITGLRLA